MPKVKIPRKSTTVDMTAMCDVAFLLLTFFMLTTKFKPDDPVIIDTPSSISEIKLPETDILTITISKENKVFFGIDGQFTRQEMLKKISEKYAVNFTPEEIHNFSITSSFGVPVASLKEFLNKSSEERDKIKQPGIPADSLNNQLADWILFARQSNPKFRIAVKGDREANYPIVKRVIQTLQDRKVNKFNFITSLENSPQGS